MHDIPICSSASPGQKTEYWIPTTSLEQMARTEYDVLIVGTGAGGGSVLWRLCERWAGTGKRIGIIERGSPLIPTHARNIPTLSSFSDRYMNYVFQDVTELPSTLKGTTQLIGLGGNTLFWGTVSTRGLYGDPSHGVVPVEEMLVYYNIAEKAMNVTQNFAQGSALTEILISRLQNNGFPLATYVPLAVDLQATKYGEIHSNVAFSSLILMARAQNTRNFDLGIKARATRVLTDYGRAAGIEVISEDKKTYQIRAKTVVLAASTFETPRILLYSGLGGRAVGHYLETHSLPISFGTVNRNEFPENLGTLSLLIPRTESNEFQIDVRGPGDFYWYQYKERPLMEQLDLIMTGVGPVESRYENYVELVPSVKDEDGIPQLKIHFSYSPKDMSVIRQGGASMIKASKALGMTPPANAPQVCLSPPEWNFHLMGTCRMGNDPLTSVTNQHAEVHGTPGLFIADNSVISQNGAANPTLTCVALAIRTADYIVGRS